VKKLIASAVAALAIIGGGTTIALAGPGPNGHNNHGLCTAYFNGSDTGRENKHNAGPFVALEKAAVDGGYQDQDGESVEHAVMDYCNATTDKGIGGNPTLPES
jgi:hypothetical protein